MMNRYTFLYVLLMLALSLTMQTTDAQTINIPDSDWRLLPDTAAQWEDDDIYLPGTFEINQLPANPPTEGWQMLNDNNGKTISLPSTVEQHFWGEFGFKPYDNQYYFERGDDQVKNGSYNGVSWWWKNITIPASMKGKKILLHIRGARLRAEVYLNNKLVGYNIITETAFSCDLSEAANPGGKNLLAIRITNPGGRFDWLDTKLMKWGEYEFHASHGFGGLDGSITITAHDPVYIADQWIANTPDINTIIAHPTITNTSDNGISAHIKYIISHKNCNNPLYTQEQRVTIPAGESLDTEEEITYEQAELWNLTNPKLYNLKTIITIDETNWKDSSTSSFGFRWFEADGIGENAVFRLNGERIRLVSAISWGFWGYNGLFPQDELAQREVLAAKSFGMNCIQFHRNIGKTAVLNAQDSLGLLRYMEPGGGQTVLGDKYTFYADTSPQEEIDVSGKEGDADSFAEKYMEEKLIRMVQDHRKHPSLVMYSIQNEFHPNLRNPRIYRVLRRMHEQDPSRIVMLKSGIPPRNQVWMQPYDETMYLDDGTGYSGFWDQHTVGGPGVWKDNMYIRPDSLTHYSDNKKEIVVWGEMLGAAVADNHQQMVNTIENNGGNSYDLLDHKEILDAYNTFLDKWSFRKAFPQASDLFLDIGIKSYDFWGRVIETAKLADANDYLVIRGWESTAIENHSGLVDNLRNYKGDPELLYDRLRSVKPVIKPKTLVIGKEQSTGIDLFLLNESNKPISGDMLLIATTPSGRMINMHTFQIPEYQKDQFVYQLSTNIQTPAIDETGFMTLTLKHESDPTICATEKILIVEPYNTFDKNISVGVKTLNKEFISALNEFPQIQAEKYQSEKEYDAIIVSTRILAGSVSVVDDTVEIHNTEDDVLYRTESWGYHRNHEIKFTGLKNGKATVTLRFAEVTLSGEGDRVFDVAINGKTVLDEFDVTVAAGGIHTAIDTTFETTIDDGMILINVPDRTVNYGKFSAVKIETEDTIIAVNCGGEPYTDANGLIWDVYKPENDLSEDILTKTENGTPLLLLPEGPDAVDIYASTLAEKADYSYSGHVGSVRASWMGSWYFVRDHELMEGLPVDQAMKSYYQVPVRYSDGVLIDSGNIDAFIGFGRDHDRNIGIGGFTTTVNNTPVVFYSIPGMSSGMELYGDGIHHIIQRKMISNAISYLINK